MQVLNDISDVVKRRMLEMYVKKSRQRYTHQWQEYKKKLKRWEELERSQRAIKEGSLDLIKSFGDRGSKYLAQALDQYALVTDKPQWPAPNIVLPAQVMQQVLAKALDHTQRINRGKGGPKSIGVTIGAAKPQKTPSLFQ
jgi:hypothetical protein